MAYNTRNRYGNRKKAHTNKAYKKRWQLPVYAGVFLVLGLLLIVIIKNSNDSHALKPQENSIPATKHYNGLEKTKGGHKQASKHDYEGFTLSFNPDNHTPDWVGWELLSSEISDKASRSDNFWQDYNVKGCPSPADYKYSGFDKGHLCPAADQKWSAAAMSDCFVMANMAPQSHALNAGAWLTLEEKERQWAKRDSAIIIVAGPIYTDSDKLRLGDTGVRVPSAFFKVFLAPYTPTPRAIGFIFPNMKAPGNMKNYAMSVDDVEKITGLDFFYSLPDNIENNVESNYNFSDWMK